MTHVRVLLVEDDPTFAKLLQIQLRTLDEPPCEVVHAATLADALRRLTEERFDVVLTDMGLPDSRGSTTLTALDEAAKGTPIVVLSGSEEAPRGRAFLRKGGIGPADLADAIQRVLGGRP